MRSLFFRFCISELKIIANRWWWDNSDKSTNVIKAWIYCLFILMAERCSEPMSEGSCSDYILLWYFHVQSGECRPFVYGGCGGNRNRFSSKQECQSWCVMERGAAGRGDVLSNSWCSVVLLQQCENSTDVEITRNILQNRSFTVSKR